MKTLITILILLTFSFHADAQTHTWATGAAEYNKPTIKVQDFGTNDIKVYIDVPNYPNRYATFIKKSFFPGFKIVIDTVYEASDSQHEGIANDAQNQGGGIFKIDQSIMRSWLNSGQGSNALRLKHLRVCWL